MSASQDSPVRPPRLAEWLAVVRMPPDRREFLLGDLDEEFRERVAADGYRPARRWYWQQAWRAALTSRRADPSAATGSRARHAFVPTLLQDTRFALRLFRRAPGHTAIVVLTLAIGIGATTAVFSVTDAVVLRPWPYPNPEQLVQVAMARPTLEGGRWAETTYADVLRWRRLPHVFSHVAASEGTTNHLLDDTEVESVTSLKISPDYFQTYGVTPVVGRSFTEQDARPGAPPVMLLGYDYWRLRLNGDRTVVGRDLRFLEGFATVVGVAPRSLSPRWGSRNPLAPAGNTLRPLVIPADPTTLPVMSVIARLRPGVTVEIAQKALRDDAAAWAAVHARELTAIPFVTSYIGRGRSMGQELAVLVGAVALVLLIACVNVSGLQFARGTTRRHELTIRTALGAGRLRLIRQVLTEAVVIALVGGLAGVGFAWLTLDILVANLRVPMGSVRLIEINPVALAITMVLSVTIGLAVGLLPALRLSEVRPSATLGSARVGLGPTMSRRGGRALIALEVALALVLLTGTALMTRSLARLHAVDLGFQPDRYLTLDVRMLGPNDPATSWFYPTLLQRVRTLPDAAAAGAISSGSRRVELMGQEGGPLVPPPLGMDNRSVLPGYFEAAGLRLRAGRFPTERDLTGASRLVVMSESAATYVFGASNAVGRRLEIDVGRLLVFDVIGVVADVRRSGPRRPAEPELYPVFREGDPLAMPNTIVARPAGSAGDLAIALRTAVQSMGLRVRAPAISIGDRDFVTSIANDRQRTLLLGIAGALGLMLALVGIVATTAYAVARRRQEVGVRMAMGAAPGEVVWEIVRDAARPIAIGLALGLGGALLSTRAIASFLFETTPNDPLALAAAVAVLGLAGLVAAWIPARRAALIDPVATLRSE